MLVYMLQLIYTIILLCWRASTLLFIEYSACLQFTDVADSWWMLITIYVYIFIEHAYCIVDFDCNTPMRHCWYISRNCRVRTTPNMYVCILHETITTTARQYTEQNTCHCNAHYNPHTAQCTAHNTYAVLTTNVTAQCIVLLSLSRVSLHCRHCTPSTLHLLLTLV